MSVTLWVCTSQMFCLLLNALMLLLEQHEGNRPNYGYAIYTTTGA